MTKWLVKSEPSVCSIDSLEKGKVTLWDGVRNYQARNFLREMKLGEKVLFYHSSEDPVGVAGIAKVVKTAYPDPTQFDPKSDYYDAGSKKDNPRWWCPDLGFEKKFGRLVTLAELRENKKLSKMSLLQKGSRLSVHQMSEDEFDIIVEMAKSKK